MSSTATVHDGQDACRISSMDSSQAGQPALKISIERIFVAMSFSLLLNWMLRTLRMSVPGEAKRSKRKRP